jgi:site-specific DNA recombinase
LELAIALLVKRGVEVHACNRGLISDEDDETSQIQNSVDGLVSGIERRNLRRRLTRGIVEKVTVNQKLPASGTAPYGYSYIGSRRERTLVICEEEAETVRHIFEWYVEGVTVYQICARLQSMRIPIPGVKHDNRGLPVDQYHWLTATVYRILKHTIYAGTFQAFKLHKAGRKKVHTTVPVPAPAIVSRELFDRAQERMASGRRNSPRNVKRFYLLRSRVRCGNCGHALCGITDRIYRYYRCVATIRRRDTKKQCNAPSFIAADAEYTLWQWIEQNVLHEDNLREGIEAKNANVSSQRAKLQEEHDYYSRKLDENTKQSARLKQLYMAELYTLEEVATEKRQLDASRAKLEADCAAVEQRIAMLGVSEDDARELLETVRAIKDKAQHLTDEGKRKVIDLCDAMATIYLRDGVPWMRIEVQLTLQSDDIVIVSQPRYGFRL